MALTELDRNLIARCLNRDPGSWNNFVDRFIGLFVHVINHTLRAHGIRSTQDDIDDLCSEIFVAILASDMKVLRNFRGKSSLASYLLVIGRRVVLRSLATRRRAEMPQIPTTPPVSPPAAEETPELNRIEDREEVEALMQVLNEQDADIVKMFHLDQLSYAEIESKTGIPRPTIGSILSRAREKMRTEGNIQV